MVSIERNLDWAFEVVTRPVLKKQFIGEVLGGNEGKSPYDVHTDAAFLIGQVDRLPEAQRCCVRVKHAAADDLSPLANVLSSEFGVPQRASEVFILHWADAANKPAMKTLCDTLQLTKSAISKRYAKICTKLDNLYTDSVSGLRPVLVD